MCGTFNYFVAPVGYEVPAPLEPAMTTVFAIEAIKIGRESPTPVVLAARDRLIAAIPVEDEIHRSRLVWQLAA